MALDKHKIKISEKQIQKVLSKINKELKSIKLKHGGFVNPIYIVETKDNIKLVLKITHPLWIKFKTLNEVTTINFLKENTNIPVPKIYDYSITRELIGHEYILMEFIQGKQLSEIYNKISEKEKLRYLEQIANYIVEMKQFKFDKIGCFQENMKIGIDVKIGEGPFDNFKDFAQTSVELRTGWMKDVEARFQKYIPKFKEFNKKIVGKCNLQTEFVFTYNDLVTRNIIVKNGKVKALIDFEWAGSFPYFDDIISLVDFKLDKFEKGKELFYNILKKGNVKTDLPEEIKDIYEILTMIIRLTAYKNWFVDKETEAEEYIQDQCKKLDKLLKKYEL